MVLEALGERAAAAEQLTLALRHEPRSEVAAWHLAALLARGVLPPGTRLDAMGLVAALAHDGIDRDLVAAAALAHRASSGRLARAVETGRRRGWQRAAHDLCLVRSDPLLADPLLLEVLRRGIVVQRDAELLLTALRRAVLLDLPRERLADPTLATFLAALAVQGWLGEHVWAEGDDETAAVAALSPDVPRIASGACAAIRDLQLLVLYRRPETVPGLDAESVAGAMPPALASALAARLDEAGTIARHATEVASLGPITSSVSLEVAAQYEASPYPRWTSVPLYRQGRWLDHVARYFRPGQLAFAERPFEVLVAGCGTGRQAVSAALDWGPGARVTGIDISRTSLGWARMMAERMGVTTLDLAQADIDTLPDCAPHFRGRFHVIECGGVLHHMADLFAAWRRLLACLAPGGIMLIGLYSVTARRNLARLRTEPECPGPGADMRALRLWRQQLLARPRDAVGAELIRSRDVHSASGFRDLFLNVREQPTTLAEIAAFLDAEELEFRGFADLPFEALKGVFPSEYPPGSLARWAAWEAAHPNAFTGMYQLWCTRR